MTALSTAAPSPAPKGLADGVVGFGPAPLAASSPASSPSKSIVNASLSKSLAPSTSGANSEARLVSTVMCGRRVDGVRLLAGVLGVDCAPEDDDAVRENLVADFVFDNVVYALQRGFPLSEALALVPVMRRMLTCACEGVARTQALCLYRNAVERLVKSKQVKQINVEKFSSYFLDDLLRHYRLFNFVHTQPRPPFDAHLIANVRPPMIPPPLAQSKPYDVWAYENKLNEINLRENQEAARRAEEKRRLIEEHERRLKAVVEEVLAAVMDAPSFKDKETLERIVRDIAAVHTEHLVGGMRLQVNDVVETLSFKLEKTLVPRPQALGPPPRFAPAALPAVPRKDGKDPRGSAKGSAKGKGGKKK